MNLIELLHTSSSCGSASPTKFPLGEVSAKWEIDLDMLLDCLHNTTCSLLMLHAREVA